MLVLFCGQDGRVIGLSHLVPTVGMQNGRAEFQQGGVCGCWRGAGPPDDAVQDRRSHEGAIEEGRVGHCGGESGAMYGCGGEEKCTMTVQMGRKPTCYRTREERKVQTDKKSSTLEVRREPMQALAECGNVTRRRY